MVKLLKELIVDLFNGVKVFKGKSLIVLMLLLMGCDQFYKPTEGDELFLSLNAVDFEYTSNNPHSYTSVTYQTLPRTRVFWHTPDTYEVWYMNRIFIEPIIRYSTYANDVGEGKQMVYISNQHIGKTLTIIGCVSDFNSELCETIQFKVLRSNTLN